jgi:hypothetical protein
MKEKKQTYAEMLKDPRWQQKRLEIMQRDNFTCQHCGAKDRELQIHHLIYNKNNKPWEYKDDELITLCSKCHEIESECNCNLYNSFLELKQSFKQRGFSMELLSSCLDILAWSCSPENTDIRDRCENTDKFIGNMIYGTQNYKDAVIATKIGIDCREFVECCYPQMIPFFDKEVGYEK